MSEEMGEATALPLPPARSTTSASRLDACAQIRAATQSLLTSSLRAFPRSRPRRLAILAAPEVPLRFRKDDRSYDCEHEFCVFLRYNFLAMTREHDEAMLRSSVSPCTRLARYTRR